MRARVREQIKPQSRHPLPSFQFVLQHFFYLIQGVSSNVRLMIVS